MSCGVINASNNKSCSSPAKFMIISINKLCCGRHIMMEYNSINNTKHKISNILYIPDICEYKNTNSFNNNNNIIDNIQDIVDNMPSTSINMEEINRINNIISEFIQNKYNVECDILDKINKDKKIRIFKCTIDNKPFLIKIGSDPESIEQIYIEFCIYRNFESQDDIIELLQINGKQAYHRIFNQWAFIIYNPHGIALPAYINEHRAIDNGIIENMFDVIEFIHSNKVVCSLMSPDKFIINETTKKIKFYDLSNALLWSDMFDDAIPQKELHELPSKLKSLYYCSRNANNKKTTSRIDDFESLVYIILTLINYKLPWSRSTTNVSVAKQKEEFILMPPVDIPEAIYPIIEIIKTTNFQEKPNYVELKKLFLEILE